jgi:hypothetical protein
LHIREKMRKELYTIKGKERHRKDFRRPKIYTTG